jgi:biopolymer transport protein ExbD
MRMRRMPEIREGAVNVTPLIDVVMCLIIFFMLVARIGIDTGKDKTIQVPTAFLGTDIKDMGNTLTLNVVNGPPGVHGAQPVVTALPPGKRQLVELKLRDDSSGKPVTPLRDLLTYYREGDPIRGMAANPDFKVIIRGDKSLTYQFLAPVLLECNLAHVKSFAFDTKKPE